MGLYHFVLTTSKTSPGKLKLTLLETQQMPETERTDSEKNISNLVWTIFNGRREVTVNFQIDTDKLNNVNTETVYTTS